MHDPYWAKQPSFQNFVIETKVCSYWDQGGHKGSSCLLRTSLSATQSYDTKCLTEEDAAESRGQHKCRKVDRQEHAIQKEDNEDRNFLRQRSPALPPALRAMNKQPLHLHKKSPLSHAVSNGFIFLTISYNSCLRYLLAHHAFPRLLN